MFTTVGTKLFTIVDGVSGFANVYNYGVKLWDEGYPLASVTPSNSKEEPFDNVRDTIDIWYDVTIYVKGSNLGTNEGIIRWLVDSVMVALRADPTLTGTAYGGTYEIERWYSNDEQPLRIAIIKCIYKLCIV